MVRRRFPKVLTAPQREANFTKVLTAPQREAKFFMLFYETNPLHRLARLNCLAPALLVTDESDLGWLASTANFSGCCGCFPKGPVYPDLGPPPGAVARAEFSEKKRKNAHGASAGSNEKNLE